jgi:hypothetical protein
VASEIAATDPHQSNRHVSLVRIEPLEYTASSSRAGRSTASVRMMQKPSSPGLERSKFWTLSPGQQHSRLRHDEKNLVGIDFRHFRLVFPQNVPESFVATATRTFYCFVEKSPPAVFNRFGCEAWKSGGRQGGRRRPPLWGLRSPARQRTKGVVIAHDRPSRTGRSAASGMFCIHHKIDNKRSDRFGQARNLLTTLKRFRAKRIAVRVNKMLKKTEM